MRYVRYSHQIPTLTTLMNHRQRLLALLGILRIGSTPPPLKGTPTHVEQCGHWEVEHLVDGARWTCLCGRSRPIELTSEEQEAVRLPKDGEHSCDVCRKQRQDARTKYSRLRAWVNQHRNTLSKEACAVLPKDISNVSTPAREIFGRYRREVFEEFWRQTVPSGTCVHLKCQNEFCINPHHLWLTKTPASKLPDKVRIEAEALASIGISTRGILAVLHERHSIKLSLKSVQRIVKETNESKNLVTW